MKNKQIIMSTAEFNEFIRENMLDDETIIDPGTGDEISPDEFKKKYFG